MQRALGVLACLAGAAILLRLASPARSAAQPVAVGASPDLPGLESFVDGVVAHDLTAQRVAGVQVAIVKDGRALLVKGYGLASAWPVRAVDPQRSLFRLGSISKTFVWLALMQLAERGKLALTDPINRHLPAQLAIPDAGFERPIRVLDLMNHTAGFEQRAGSGASSDDAKLRGATAELTQHRPARVREPGWLFSYSNYGANLAGQLVAHIAGMDFETYVERHILEPLELHHTTFREGYGASAPRGLPAPMPAALLPERAYGLEWVNGEFRQFPPEHILDDAAAGAAVSTADDMARYMLALLDPSRLARAGVLGEGAYAELQRVSFEALPGLGGVHHGFFDRPGGRSVLGHENLWHGGHVAHYFADLTVFPKLGLGVFVGVNSNPGGKLASALREHIIARYFPSTASLPRADARDLSEYAGQYRTTRRSYTQLAAALTLGAVSVVRAVPDGLLVSAPGSDGPERYRPIGHDLFQKIDSDARVGFLRDARGSITHFVSLLESGERVRLFDSAAWLYTWLGAAWLASVGLVLDAWKHRRRSLDGGAGVMASLLAVLGASWLVTLSEFAVCDVGLRFGLIQLDFDPDDAAPAWLRIMLLSVWIATALSALSALTLCARWRRSGWSLLRRISHVLALLVFIALCATLQRWNVINFY